MSSEISEDSEEIETSEENETTVESDSTVRLQTSSETTTESSITSSEGGDQHNDLHRSDSPSRMQPINISSTDAGEIIDLTQEEEPNATESENVEHDASRTSDSSRERRRRERQRRRRLMSRRRYVEYVSMLRSYGGHRPYVCSVCLEFMLRQHPTSTPCGHVFCARCINRAVCLRGKCPLCNRRIHRSMLIRLYL